MLDWRKEDCSGSVLEDEDFAYLASSQPQGQIEYLKFELILFCLFLPPEMLLFTLLSLHLGQ